MHEKAPAVIRTPLAKAKDRRSTTIYMPREPFERLRLMAFARRESINTMITEALDLMFKKEGFSERFTSKT